MPTHSIADIYDTHAPALYRFLRALTGDEEDTRDLIQDTFVRFTRHYGKTEILDPAAWLFRTARNLAVDRARHRGVRARAMERLSHEPPASEAETQTFESAATIRRLQLALASLPEDQRSVVHLKVWEEQTFARIAVILDISPNTAASRYRYAMDRLRASLSHISCS